MDELFETLSAQLYILNARLFNDNEINEDIKDYITDIVSIISVLSQLYITLEKGENNEKENNNKSTDYDE